jgi:hypothetical protein
VLALLDAALRAGIKVAFHHEPHPGRSAQVPEKHRERDLKRETQRKRSRETQRKRCEKEM